MAANILTLGGQHCDVRKNAGQSDDGQQSASRAKHSIHTVPDCLSEDEA